MILFMVQDSFIGIYGILMGRLRLRPPASLHAPGGTYFEWGRKSRDGDATGEVARVTMLRYNRCQTFGNIDENNNGATVARYGILSVYNCNLLLAVYTFQSLVTGLL